MTTRPPPVHLQRFRMDVARWIVPEQIADPSEVTLAVAARLLFRYLPLRAVAWFRLATWLREVGVRGFAGFAQRHLLRHYGLELSPGTQIGGGLYIAHPVGCTLTAERIGANVTVIADVTVGRRSEGRWPRLGDRVFLGAGARILGDIDIGDDAVIGANAVVIHDVTPGTTVVGVPARPAGA